VLLIRTSNASVATRGKAILSLDEPERKQRTASAKRFNSSGIDRCLSAKQTCHTAVYSSEQSDA